MPQLHELRDAIETLRARLGDAERAQTERLGKLDPSYRASATNLIHYLTVRDSDLRPLQLQLSRMGLSSLGRLEGHVLDTLTQVRDRLDDALARREELPLAPTTPALTLRADDAERLLHRHTRDLLGPKPPDRHVYVMVTAPPAVEVDDAWADAALEAGLNLLRVNGAHESPEEWAAIVGTVQRAAARRGTEVRILVDLPGPKLRTVAPREGTRVARWRPERDELGRTVRPCNVTLHDAELAAPTLTAGAAAASLALPPELFARLELGDHLELHDARDRRRTLRVVARAGDTRIAELERTAYVVPGCRVRAWRGDTDLGGFEVATVPAQDYRIDLAVGDRLRLVGPDIDPGPAEPLPVIGLTLAVALAALRAGERVLFDDGKLGTEVEAVDAGGAVLRVTRAPGGRARLRAEKGVNLPDTTLAIPALGDDDERALTFAVAHADLVGASFVRDRQDVETLYARLDALDAAHLGVVLKIETTSAFKALPELLLAAMVRQPLGVMIARGDLAVEAGFERLAELQEEILWLCEAAHLPVIWATQVLDTMARTGQASRAEITDAAMAVRAECVMLNKGPHVIEAMGALDDILRRMEQHQYKKQTLYRRLNLTLPR